MFSGGFTEVGFILFIAFLLFGPKKLPEIARVLGKGMGELRRASNELKSSLEEEIRNLDRNDDEPSYSEHETHPYTEMEEEGFEYPDEAPGLNAAPEEEETTVSEQSDETQASLSEQSEEAQTSLSEHPDETQTSLSEHPVGEPDPVPEYGYDYSEPTQHEPEPRTRG